MLDEPTAGLHPRDTKTLIACLLELRDRGNSLVVVEHDEETIRAAEWLIDLGPGAGAKGGEVVACGTFEAIAGNPRSITGKMLGSAAIQRQSRRAIPPDSDHIQIRGAVWNNLKSVDVDIPIGGFFCFTGVSGSGKSSLVLDVLGRSARRGLIRARTSRSAVQVSRDWKASRGW